MPEIVPDPTSLRLPTHIQPSAYVLDLQPDPRRASLRGHATIELAVSAPTASLLLHANELNVSDASLTREGSVQRWSADRVVYHGEDAQYVQVEQLFLLI